MAFVTVDTKLCKACSLCIEACPKGIIKLSNKLNDKGYQPVEIIDQEKCTGCAFCARICPDCVLEVER